MLLSLPKAIAIVIAIGNICWIDRNLFEESLRVEGLISVQLEQPGHLVLLE
jgi:hypothetical protein